MQKLFNKILVPVDFSSKSKYAVINAVDIAKEYNCSIHLVHVVSVSALSAAAIAEGHMAIPYNIFNNNAELAEQMNILVDRVKSITGDTIKVHTHILNGTWDEIIIDLVTQNKFDLVLIGQKGKVLTRRKMFLNPDKIAERTNVPVITLPADRRMTRLYSIVIPITDFLPVRKLIYGIYIASKYSSVVKLLGIENDKTREKVQNYLVKSGQLIRQYSRVKVELVTVYSENVSKAVNQFAKEQEADLVILNPGTQTKMPGYFSGLLGKIIQKYSAPPVLTINPV